MVSLFLKDAAKIVIYLNTVKKIINYFSYLCNCDRDHNCDHRLRLGKA